jgi:hypothetical protein
MRAYAVVPAAVNDPMDMLGRNDVVVKRHLASVTLSLNCRVCQFCDLAVPRRAHISHEGLT